MGPVLRSTTVSLLLLLLLQLTSPSHGQYMTGYGTGPFIPELMLPFPDSMDSNDPKYDGAKSASSFASEYYGNNNNIGRNDPFPNHESPYKYHAPLYPSASTGTLPPSLSQNSPYGYGAANSPYSYSAANSGYGYDAANSGYGYGAVNSGYGYDAVNSGYGYGAANSGYGYGAANSDYGYGGLPFL